MPDRARPRAVHLTSVHRPFDSRIFHKECRTLLAAGFDVVLVAPHDREETVDGVRVVPIAKAGRRLARFWRSGRDVLRRATELDGDVYHFHDPELIPVGLVLRLRGKRVIYDVHEDLPRDVLDKAWIPAWLRWLVAPQPAASRPLPCVSQRRRLGDPEISRSLPSAKHGPRTELPDSGRALAGWGPSLRARPYDAIYVGGITASRGAREMVALSSCPRARTPRWCWRVSSSPESAARLAGLTGWERVKAVGWLDRAGVASVLAGSCRYGDAASYARIH